MEKPAYSQHSVTHDWTLLCWISCAVLSAEAEALAVGCSAAAKGWFRVCVCVRMCVSTHLQYIITSSTFYQNNSLSLISTSTCMSVECILEVLMHSGGKNKGELTFLEARGALLYFFQSQ